LVVPVTFAVNWTEAPIFTRSVFGEIVTETCVGLTTEMFHAADNCPSAFNTVTGTADPVAEVDPLAVNCVVDTKLVASAVPLSRTTAPL
jgi:hypothetical protein